MSNYDIAKEIFQKYNGSHFFMEREGEYRRYKNYNISSEMEKKWFEEIKEDVWLLINKETNQKKLVTLFSNYADLVSQTKDVKGSLCMIMFVEEKMVIYDTFSIVRIIESILNSICFLENAEKNKIIQRTIVILEYLLVKPITVSDNFKENGSFPEYTRVGKIVKRVNCIIKYWG